MNFSLVHRLRGWSIGRSFLTPFSRPLHVHSIPASESRHSSLLSSFRGQSSRVRTRGSSRAQVTCVSLLPRPLTYSFRLADADPQQISELWRETLGVEREAPRIARALRHSFSVVVAIDESIMGPQGTPGRLVGIGRAVSDGAFVATICDVAVLPKYQRRGIGRRIVRELVKDMRRRGPSGFAVFPPPAARRFFWHLGFRWDKKYKLMEYQGPYLGVPAGELAHFGPALGGELRVLLQHLWRGSRMEGEPSPAAAKGRPKAAGHAILRTTAALIPDASPALAVDPTTSNVSPTAEVAP